MSCRVSLLPIDKMLVLFLVEGLDPALLLTYHSEKDIVGDVAPVSANLVGRGVAEHHGGLGDIQSVVHRVHRDVGQIHHHAQAVHLLDHALREAEKQGVCLCAFGALCFKMLLLVSQSGTYQVPVPDCFPISSAIL